jgi:hypothetical protein
MVSWRQCLLFGLVTLHAFGATLSGAEERTFGPFQVDTAGQTITLDGPIDARAALNFRRAIAAAPGAKRLVLSSSGGIVAMGLLIADDVHQRGLATLIPAGSECYSACDYVFFAGRERIAQGRLGVHQISSAAPDVEDTQLTISDILDVLNRFDTPPDVLTIMFRTPPNQIYVFSPAEVTKFGINRYEAVATDQKLVQHPPERATRVAVYLGLDFYGGDIGSSRTPDLPGCASECFASGEECRAFTFNSDKRRSGPNCFLKNDISLPDGNAVAISGLLLRAWEPDPKPLQVGVIDPRSGMVQGLDIPFRDLSGKPADNAESAQKCRIACVAHTECAAFTFVEAKQQCWLKSASDGAEHREGMVSGAKVRMTFAPSQIIELN